MTRRFVWMPLLLGTTAAMSMAMMAAPLQAQGQPADYLDDRSNAEGLVRSFYNAINRGEFARAWDYFGDKKPSGDFETFARGYEATERVDIETGPPSEEGAAGSIFFQVPTAIRATAKDGTENTFAGCYTARLISPANQEPPFRPLQLEAGALEPAQGELAEAIPASCGDGPPAPSRDKTRDAVVASFKATYGDVCLEAGAAPAAADPETHEIHYRDASQDSASPDRIARLFRFPCIQAAYNFNDVFYLADDTGGFRQLQFTEPELDIRYENEDPEGKVESTGIIGYTTSEMLTNSTYDPDTRTLRSFNKWRGVGDASSSGTWLFRHGTFTLVKYEVDATYDGEINPEPMLDYDTAP